jgi:lipopolysaccharide/colanic/teichoic acid biosynthesis glycosyltransferase
MLAIVDKPLKHWSAAAKWIEDTILGALLLLCFAPIMSIIAAAIKLDSRGPIFFSQERFGFNNGVIRVLKFRTIHVDRGDPSGAERTVRNDPRVTRVGRFLRAFSLDELPQLINVLRGEIDTVEKARQRVLFDLDYIDSWSLWLDAKLLLMSSRVPFTRENAY